MSFGSIPLCPHTQCCPHSLNLGVFARATFFNKKTTLFKRITCMNDHPTIHDTVLYVAQPCTTDKLAAHVRRCSMLSPRSKARGDCWRSTHIHTQITFLTGPVCANRAPSLSKPISSPSWPQLCPTRSPRLNVLAHLLPNHT